LTALGGGVFGNDFEWVGGAMRRAFNKFRDADLTVHIVVYAPPIEPELASLVEEFGGGDGLDSD